MHGSTKGEMMFGKFKSQKKASSTSLAIAQFFTHLKKKTRKDYKQMKTNLKTLISGKHFCHRTQCGGLW